MTLAELTTLADDDTPVAIMRADGTLDYAIEAWLSDDPESKGTLVITGN